MDLDYKKEIISSRKKGLGASDGKLLARISRNGCVQSSDIERLAIAKGLHERLNIQNIAMRYGDFIENKVFESLQMINPNYKSNLYFESKELSREGLKLFCHIDFSLQDDERKILVWTECKATTTTVEQTKKDYIEQLFIEWLLCQEMAAELGYMFQLRLCHYDATEMLDEDGDFKFDPEKLTISDVNFEGELFDIWEAMDIASEYVNSMTEYHKEEIEWEYLPEPIQRQMEVINTSFVLIKEREAEINEFKDRMYKFLCDNDVKSIKTPFFSISRVDESFSISFDSKKFKEEEPDMYNKYTKSVKKKGYALIKLKDKTKNEK